MSTSFRNVLKRKVHKERHQPAARARFGLLEKHSDYKLRADDYNSKQARLQILKEKAAMRNPDEFYYSMHKTKTRGGVHRDTRTNRELDPDTVRLLKSQDRRYLEYKARTERRQIDMLRGSLAFMGAAATSGPAAADADSDDDSDGSGAHPAAPRHVVFVNSDDDDDGDTDSDRGGGGGARDAKRPRLAGATAAAASKSAAKSASSSATSASAASSGSLPAARAVGKKELNRAARARIARYTELEQRLQRERALRHAIAEKNAERIGQAKGRKSKVVEGSRDQAPIYKFRKERRK
jgi:U3 small nucleolar RNA-associated protein 11